MKQTMIGKTHFATFLAATAILVGVAGCSREIDTPGDDPASGAATIKITTRSFTSDPLDEKVEKIRIIAFRDGRVRSNRTFPVTYVMQTINYVIPSGTYDFVFLVNEPSSLTASLEALRDRATLNKLSIPADDINRNSCIPQIKEYKGVVIANNTITHREVNGGFPINDWRVLPGYLASRIEVSAFSKRDLLGIFEGVKITGMPDRVPLVPMSEYTGTPIGRIEREYLLANDTAPKYFQGKPVMTEPWELDVVRLVVPFNEFTPANNPDKAMVLSFLLRDEPSPSATMCLADNNHTLPRGYCLEVTGKVKSPLELHITPKPWEHVPVHDNIDQNRRLDVSATKLTLTPLNMARVAFSSNQPNVTLESDGFNLDDYYTADITYSNLEESAGVIEFKVVDNPRTIGHVSRKVMVNAGGLKREITIESWLWNTPPTPYVGTFHRASEMGERIVTFKNSGRWRAMVMNYPAGTTPFVVLSSRRSIDPMAGTDTPGDPEDYPVTPDPGSTDDGKSVRGEGNVYFRVGMKSRLSTANPDDASRPRYALIDVILGDGKIKTIFVRQGEAPNLLVKPQADQQFWKLAQKFSVYNVASNGEFVDYPTKGGGYFKPFFTSETKCPAGYRRYKFGATGVDRAKDNEALHSLWKDPDYYNSTSHLSKGIKDGDRDYSEGITNSNVRYSSWGYYADGYFDRRPKHGPDNSIVGSGSEAAYEGHLFYNSSPRDNLLTSIFFPAAGSGTPGGKLYNAGKIGHYLSDFNSTVTVPGPGGSFTMTVCNNSMTLLNTEKGGHQASIYVLEGRPQSLRCVRK